MTDKIIRVCSECGVIGGDMCRCGAPYYPRLRIHKKYLSVDGKRVNLTEWSVSRKREQKRRRLYR
jgi:hypothetical protein